jgi:DNA-binding transcriptional regulator YhcF (GntR family)
MYQLKLNPTDKKPKYKQIVDSIIIDIEKTILKDDEQLPSISELSEEYYLARDTVEKAYKELKERGYITSVQGKGFYVERKTTNKLKILLVFNKLSSYKKIIYYSFLRTLGDKAKVDLQIHHYNATLFKEIIENNLGKYNYYVIMPHFFQDIDKVDYLKIIQSIPAEELVLLDKDLPQLNSPHLSVYQDFEKDIYTALESATDLLEKYKKLILVFPNEANYPFNYPLEIVQGFCLFCIEYNKEFDIVESAFDQILYPGTAYITVEETDLAELIKKVRQSSYLLGREIGIISFNETTLKELLNITVITTDFETMGRITAALLLENKQIKIKNTFSMIRRNSL